MTDNLLVSGPPHIATRASIAGIMWRVNAALMPAAIASIAIFGLSSLKLMVAAVTAAVFSEGLIQRLMRRRVTVLDGSAFMTGLLLAFNLPPQAPLWMAALGSVFAIGVAKAAFGGPGENLFNPALAGRAFLVFFWPSHMTAFKAPFLYDAVTQATPLTLVKEGRFPSVADMGLTYWDLFLGHRGGCLGEVCGLALIGGGLYLLWKKIITWHIPLTYIASTGIAGWIFGSRQGYFRGDFIAEVLCGGLLLGAVYMATDPVTSPITAKGRIVFGIGCGILTAVIRIWGSYPEGVCYAILVMNAAVPWIDRWTQPRRYGRQGAT